MARIRIQTHVVGQTTHYACSLPRMQCAPSQNPIIKYNSLFIGHFHLFIIGLRNLFYQKVGRLYKNMGILLGWCLTVKNWWGILSGDGGVGFRGLSIHMFAMKCF